MKPQNKYLTAWKEANQNYGTNAIAIKARLDVRTIKNAIAGREIDPATFEKINTAIVSLKARDKRLLKKLGEE